MCRSQKALVGPPFDGIAEGYPAARRVADPAPNREDVVVPGGRSEPELRLYHGQPQAAFLQRPVAHSLLAHVCRARRLAPDEIIGMVGDAHLIGFRVPHANLSFGDRSWCHAALAKKG